MSLSGWLLQPWSSELLFVRWFLSCELILFQVIPDRNYRCVLKFPGDHVRMWHCFSCSTHGCVTTEDSARAQSQAGEEGLCVQFVTFKVSVTRWPSCCCQELEWAGTPQGLGEKHLGEDPKSAKACMCPTQFHPVCHSQYLYNAYPGWVIPQWWSQSGVVQLGDASWPPT